VLFIDLIDFTPYSEGSDPEQVRSMQNEYFSAVRRTIRHYGGVVEKYIGDAVMAVFGAPVVTESDALRCVRAGLELQQALPRRLTAASTELRFRIGITTGEALVNVAAAHDGGQGIVAGDVVSTASRLQSVAPSGGVIVCETTYLATRSGIDYVEQDTVTLRGHSRPTRVWLAVGARHDRPGPGAEPTPMINREHEIGMLVSALDRAVRDRTPRLVTIFGEAGIGKSRLVRELARAAGVSARWRVGHCPPFGENVTYAALAEVIKAEAGLLDTDDESTARQRLVETLRRLVGPDEVDRFADALGPLVGLPWAHLSAAETESAWRRFIVALASDRPTVLVFEDMHWADEPMLRFVETLCGSVHDVPLLIVATSRPELRESHPTWTGTVTGAVSISLPPLRDADISQMYAQMFGDSVFPDDMLQPLVELADGNPLYAHEYVRMLVEKGLLRQIGPLWSLEPGDAGPPMPDSVQAVIANRLDLLDSADRSILQTAAVVGIQFWPGSVAAALGAPVERVQRALARLEQRGLVQERRASTMAGETEFRFRHVLVRDVCYRRLPRAERVARHQRVANWLDAVTDGRHTDVVEVLANHRWAAHEIARNIGLDTTPYAAPARESLYRAARRAYALHALATAANLAERALSLKLDRDLMLELLAAELGLYHDGDRFFADGGIDRLEELATALLDAGDQAAAARAWTLLGTAALTRADRPGCLAHLDRAVQLYTDLPDSEEKAAALLELARVHMMNYENGPAIAAADAAAEMAERCGLAEVRANAMITLAMAGYISGDPDGLTTLTEITEQCRQLRLVSRRRAVHNLAWAVHEEGDIAGSARLIDEQNSVDIAGGYSLATGFADEAGRAFFAGDWERSLRAVSASMSRNRAEWDLGAVAISAWLRVLREEEAGDEVDEVLEVARRSGFHRPLRAALANAALCRALQGHPSQAQQLLSELELDWAATRMLAFAEWVAPASHAAATLGPPASAQVRRMLQRAPHPTPWVHAGLATVAGALGVDQPTLAAGQHREAARVYGRIGTVSHRMLSLAACGRALLAAGDTEAARPVVAEVTAFARRNRAGALLAGLT
jgi:class 3 adenylate cyclase